jgi:hypothetical protein
VFYVKDVFGLKITQEQKRRQISRRLARALGVADDGQRQAPARKAQSGS